MSPLFLNGLLIPIDGSHCLQFDQFAAHKVHEVSLGKTPYQGSLNSKTETSESLPEARIVWWCPSVFRAVWDTGKGPRAFK